MLSLSLRTPSQGNWRGEVCPTVPGAGREGGAVSPPSLDVRHLE